MSHDETKREEIPVFEVTEKTHRKLSDPDCMFYFAYIHCDLGSSI